jgi:hypothetical protein
MSGEERPGSQQPGKWVMTSRVSRDPWQLRFFIGAVPVARIEFYRKGYVMLTVLDTDPIYFQEPKAVSKAMSAMHEMLRSPPREPSKGETDGY